MTTLHVKHLIGMVLVAAISLGACSRIDSIRSVVSTVAALKIPRQEVILAVDAYAAIENTGTAYLRAYARFPGRCDGVRFTQPFCRDPAVHRTVDGAIYAGRAAAGRASAYLRAHPNDDGLKADYDALVGATDAIKSATAAWRAAVAQ